MSESATTTGDKTTVDSPGREIEVVELELTVDDQFYYVSREVGDTFKTLPYIMHTALYYATGLLPSQFRSTTNKPQYEEHYQDSEIAQDVYIHPATPLSEATSTTRRFACKGDEYRVDTEKENKNLKETGFQEYLDPGTTFRTFIRVDPASDTSAQDIVDEIPPYIRTGKKMTSTQVETHIHTATVKHGEFELGQPIGTDDLARSEYHTFKNLDRTLMNPVNLLEAGAMTGEYVTIEPVRTPAEGVTETVALPVHTNFLGY